MKTVYDIMAEKHADLNRREFAMRQTWPYEAKVRHARRMVENFYAEICNVQERNVHVSVGGLDSITLFIFIRDVCHLPGADLACTLKNVRTGLIGFMNGARKSGSFG